MADDLKVPVMTKVTDPRFGTTTMELTNINRSQPDSPLFQVPSDYTVKKGPRGRGFGPGSQSIDSHSTLPSSSLHQSSGHCQSGRFRRHPCPLIRER